MQNGTGSMEVMDGLAGQSFTKIFSWSNLKGLLLSAIVFFFYMDNPPLFFFYFFFQTDYLGGRNMISFFAKISAFANNWEPWKKLKFT